MPKMVACRVGRMSYARDLHDDLVGTREAPASAPSSCSSSPRSTCFGRKLDRDLQGPLAGHRAHPAPIVRVSSEQK
jgi:hypothetical protein